MVAAKRQIVNQKMGQHLHKIMKKHMATPAVKRDIENKMPINVGLIKKNNSTPTESPQSNH
jgi:hypothetical protein